VQERQVLVNGPEGGQGYTRGFGPLGVRTDVRYSRSRKPPTLQVLLHPGRKSAMDLLLARHSAVPSFLVVAACDVGLLLGLNADEFRRGTRTATVSKYAAGALTLPPVRRFDRYLAAWQDLPVAMPLADVNLSRRALFIMSKVGAVELRPCSSWATACDSDGGRPRPTVLPALRLPVLGYSRRSVPTVCLRLHHLSVRHLLYVTFSVCLFVRLCSLAVTLRWGDLCNNRYHWS
jgi:hypothetical protein